MPTPTWKKKFILIFGLFENLIFSGTILGWSALNYMLKSEGVYQNICDNVKPHFQINDNNYSFIERNSIQMKSNVNNNKLLLTDKKANTFSKAIINLLLADSHNDTNVTLLEQLEAYNMEPIFSPIHQPLGCSAQDKLLNLAFTIGTFAMGFTAFIWGFLLQPDKFGLRLCRILINSLLTGGAVLLCFTDKDRPYLIYPAVTLLCFGGVPLRIANMQFANLYPSKRSTVISLYSGAFCASAVVFVLLKYLFDFGLSYFMVTLLLALSSLLMFPFTFFILPSDCIREESEDNSSNINNIFNRKKMRSSFSIISPVTLEKFAFIASPHLMRKALSKAENIDNKNSVNVITNNSNNNKPVFWIKDQNLVTAVTIPIANSNNSPPLKISLWSWAFNLHQWWFSWLITYMVMYVGSMNLWLQRVTDDFETAGNFAKIYGIAQVIGLILAPIAGLFMDYSVKKADQETDPFKRKLQRVRAGFWPLFITTLFLSACIGCRFFNNEIAIYFSIAFMTIFRSFLIAVGTAYLRIRFHGEHFNRLLGIISTTGSIVSLLQFPLFVWESQQPMNALWVNVFNCLCTLLAFSNPLHILFTPIQRHLLHKEEKEEAEAKSH